jgi:predicted outer membrane protein
MPGATETEFRQRGDVMGTKVGTAEKDDTAKLRRGRCGISAMAVLLIVIAASASAQSNTRAPGGGLDTPAPNETGAASANNPTATSETQPGKGLTGGRGGGDTDTTGVSQGDRDFVGEAMKYARAEIDTGRLALTASHTDKVLMFAHQAIDTGESTLAPIERIASSVGIRETDPETMAVSETRQLKAAEGTVFDGLYGDLAARDQKGLMALYGKEAETGRNGRLKSFAAVERQHIDVMLHDARLLKAGTISHVDPACPGSGPAKLGCP